MHVFAEPTRLSLLGRGGHEHERGYSDGGEQDLANGVSSSIVHFPLKGQLEDNCLHSLDAGLILPCATYVIVRAFSLRQSKKGGH